MFDSKTMSLSTAYEVGNLISDGNLVGLEEFNDYTDDYDEFKSSYRHVIIASPDGEAINADGIVLNCISEISDATYNGLGCMRRINLNVDDIVTVINTAKIPKKYLRSVANFSALRVLLTKQFLGGSYSTLLRDALTFMIYNMGDDEVKASSAIRIFYKFEGKACVKYTRTLEKATKKQSGLIHSASPSVDQSTEGILRAILGGNLTPEDIETLKKGFNKNKNDSGIIPGTFGLRDRLENEKAAFAAIDPVSYAMSGF